MNLQPLHFVHHTDIVFVKSNSRRKEVIIELQDSDDEFDEWRFEATRQPNQNFLI